MKILMCTRVYKNGFQAFLQSNPFLHTPSDAACSPLLRFSRTVFTRESAVGKRTPAGESEALGSSLASVKSNPPIPSSTAEEARAPGELSRAFRSAPSGLWFCSASFPFRDQCLRIASGGGCKVPPRESPRGVAAPGLPPHPPGREGSRARGVVGAPGGLWPGAIHPPTARGPTQEGAPRRGPPAGCTRLSLTATAPALLPPSARGCPGDLRARPLGPGLGGGAPRVLSTPSPGPLMPGQHFSLRGPGFLGCQVGRPPS